MRSPTILVYATSRAPDQPAHHLEFLSLKRGCTGSSESTLVKIPHCWKSHVVAQISKHMQKAPAKWSRVSRVYSDRQLNLDRQLNSDSDLGCFIFQILK